jgi:hypothetical protein
MQIHVQQHADLTSTALGPRNREWFENVDAISGYGTEHQIHVAWARRPPALGSLYQMTCKQVCDSARQHVVTPECNSVMQLRQDIEAGRQTNHEPPYLFGSRGSTHFTVILENKYGTYLHHHDGSQASY